jgi:hypothetical protein
MRSDARFKRVRCLNKLVRRRLSGRLLQKLLLNVRQDVIRVIDIVQVVRVVIIFVFISIVVELIIVAIIRMYIRIVIVVIISSRVIASVSTRLRI